MKKQINRTVVIVTLLSLAMFALSSWGSFAQERRTAYEDWYGNVKKTLADHYTGKTVKLRMAIPATRRGLEMNDGALTGITEKDTAQSLAQPGDEVTIKNFKVGDRNIELLLNKNGAQPKRRFFSWPKQPRINLRFSRELNAQDMTVESINHWLAAAVDISALGSTTAEEPSNATPPSNAATQASLMPVASVGMDAGPKPSSVNGESDLATATVIGDLPNVGAKVGELTVESSVGQARVYIDNAYSGFAPRTVHLRAGVHTILVMANGYAAWEQRLLIPGGKASAIKAELRR